MRLVPTETEFSLVVQVLYTKAVFVGSAQYGSPEVWPQNGLQTNGTFPRDWALDIVVW